MGCCENKDRFLDQNEHQISQFQQQNYNPREEEINIANLKNIRDELYFKRKDINFSIEKAEAEIRAKIQKQQKNSAKFALQKKKLYDEYLQQLDSKYLIICRMIQEVDKAMMDRSLVGVIKNTNKLLIDIKNSIDLNEMEDVMQNMKENEAQSKKFNQLFHDYNIIDDEGLEQEFNKYDLEINGNMSNNQMNSYGNQNPYVMQSQKNKNKVIINKSHNQNIKESSYEKKLESLL